MLADSGRKRRSQCKIATMHAQPLQRLSYLLVTGTDFLLLKLPSNGQISPNVQEPCFAIPSPRSFYLPLFDFLVSNDTNAVEHTLHAAPDVFLPHGYIGTEGAA